MRVVVVPVMAVIVMAVIVKIVVMAGVIVMVSVQRGPRMQAASVARAYADCAVL